MRFHETAQLNFSILLARNTQKITVLAAFYIVDPLQIASTTDEDGVEEGIAVYFDVFLVFFTLLEILTQYEEESK